MLRTVLAFFLIASLVVLSACAASPAAPVAPAATRTGVPPPTAPASPATAAPGASSPATPVAPAATQASQPATEASPAGAIRLVIVPDGTEARYRVREQLAGRDLPSDAVGTTKAVTGTLVIQPDGTLMPGQSKFVVDLRTLQSDQSRRDGYIQRNTLDTARFPTAEFIPTAVNGLPSPLPTSGDVKFQIEGDMTAHGATHPITWDATGHISEQDLTGTASTAFKFADFGMTQPRVATVLSVEDNIRLEIDYHMVAGK